MKKKIIQIKEAKKIFKNKYFKLRREDIIKLSNNKYLSNKEKEKLEKLAVLMSKGEAPNEFIVKRGSGRIILSPMDE